MRKKWSKHRIFTPITPYNSVLGHIPATDGDFNIVNKP